MNKLILHGDATVTGDYESIEVCQGSVHFTGTVKHVEIRTKGRFYVTEGSAVGDFKLHPGACYQYGDNDPVTGWC